MNILLHVQVSVHQESQRNKHERQIELVIVIIYMTGKAVGHDGGYDTESQIEEEPSAIVSFLADKKQVILTEHQPYESSQNNPQTGSDEAHKSGRKIWYVQIVCLFIEMNDNAVEHNIVDQFHSTFTVEIQEISAEYRQHGLNYRKSQLYGIKKTSV